MRSEEARGIISPQEYKKASNRLIFVLCLIVGIGLALVMLYPVFWVFSSALKSPQEIYQVPPTVIPISPAWQNFVEAWRVYEIPRMLLNTFLVFGGFLLSRLFVVVCAAYALSRLDLPFRNAIYLTFLATLMLPTAAYLIPSYLVIKDLGLYDSWWSLWIPAGANSLHVLIVKGFFDSIPKELSEASRMDGASEFTIMARVILPNSQPVVAAISIFTFLEVWNNFFWQRLILNNPDVWTMPVMIWFKSFTIGGNPPINIQLAGMFISLVPPLVLFLFFQRYITNGVTLSGMKT